MNCSYLLSFRGNTCHATALECH